MNVNVKCRVMVNEAKLKIALTELRKKINEVENSTLKKDLHLALLSLMMEIVPDDYLMQIPAGVSTVLAQRQG